MLSLVQRSIESPIDVCEGMARRTEGVNPAVIHDKLMCLEAITAYLQPLNELNLPDEPTVIFLDFNTGFENEFTDSMQPIGHKVPRYLDTMKHTMLWQSEARIQSLIEDAKNNKGSMILVEGVFTINATTLLFVSAKMRHLPEAVQRPGERRYKVLNSFYRLSQNPYVQFSDLCALPM